MTGSLSQADLIAKRLCSCDKDLESYLQALSVG